MITVEEAKKLLLKHNKDIEEAQKFYWFCHPTETKGLKESSVEELIKEGVNSGREYVNIYKYEITNLGKQKLKEFGFTVVDLYNYERTSVPYISSTGMIPTYVICLDYSFAMDAVGYYSTEENIKRESIKVY